MRRIDTERLPHFTVKCRPNGKQINGNISDFRLLLGSFLFTRPNILQLRLIIILILYNGNEYLHTFHLPNCDAWAKVHFQFRHFAMCILNYLRLGPRDNKSVRHSQK
jgi:hypothetical protein